MKNREESGYLKNHDFDEISNHILPAQNNFPLISLGKNQKGTDEADELSYIEGKRRTSMEEDESPRQ